MRLRPEQPLGGLERSYLEGGDLVDLGGHRHPVAHPNVLELRQDTFGAGAGGVVEQVIAVEASPPGTDLHDPWPHVLRCCRDRDCTRGRKRWVWDELVSWHHRDDLRIRRPPPQVPA